MHMDLSDDLQEINNTHIVSGVTHGNTTGNATSGLAGEKGQQMKNT